MKINRYASLFFFAFLLAIAPAVFGAGFALYEGSARGNALGGLAGQADDPAAIFFNPAGITQLEGKHAIGGVTFILPAGDYTITNVYDGTTTTGRNHRDLFTPPHFYYTHQLNDKLWLGLGLFSRFGLGSTFDDDWPGRYNNTDASVETLTFSPNLAWKVNDQFSVAVGLTYTYIDVRLEDYTDASALLGAPPNDPRTNTFDVKQTVEGDSDGYGYNLAAHFRPNDRWSFGLSYVSEVEEKIDNGTIRFQKPTGVALPPTFFVDANGKAVITLPDMLFLGASFNANDRLNVGVGLTRTGWSSYKELRLDFETPILVVPGFNLVVDEVTIEKNWDDVWRYNLGFEYKVNEHWNALWGFIYDETPIPDDTWEYQVPTNDRTLLNMGFRYRQGSWTLDGSYNYLVMGDRHIEQRQAADGVLETDIDRAIAHLIGFSVGYKF